jgi:hypothetical protein
VIELQRGRDRETSADGGVARLRGVAVLGGAGREREKERSEVTTAIVALHASRWCNGHSVAGSRLFPPDPRDGGSVPPNKL